MERATVAMNVNLKKRNIRKKRKMSEEWRKINLEGKRCVYYVSNEGGVKSISKKYLDNDKLVKPYLCKNGYYYVDVDNRTITVHSLIAKAFLEPQPSLTHTIDHIDRNPANNHLSNLRWATKSQQLQNSSKYRHDIAEKDPIIRKKIIHQQCREKLGYYEKVQCECGKSYVKYRKSRHEKTAYHQKHINNNL
jgi:hypothetical protein